jgi:division protein CdvB (Snf7/Vps24/ESCRT-III family)
MVLKDIMAISGEPGLFKFIAQGKNAIIVEHLETKKRSSAFGSARVSSLEEISVFTEKEDMPLGKVFDLISEKEKGGLAIDYKSDPEKLKEYLKEVLPEYDREKVYVSDIKKIVHWYNILHALNLLVKEEPEKPAEKEEAGKPEPVKEEKPKKEHAPKKEKATGEKGESAPKKKPSKSKEK